MLISKRKKPKFKGFTLVELVIVIAVIAILASVLIPTFANIIKTAKESARYQQARSARDEYLTIAQDPEYLVGTLITLKDGYYIVGDNLELIDINIDDYDINGYDIVYNVNDVSIYKKKDSIACKIVFIANDGIVSPNYSMLYIKENTKIFYSNGLLNIEVDTLPIATKNKEGYNFLFEGWIDSLDSTYTTVIDKNGTLLESKYFNAEGCYLLSKDLTLYAKYSHTLVNYSIDYDLQGGSFTGDYPKNYNVESEDFNLVEPEKEGYNFIGWTNTEIAEPQKEVTIAKGTTKNLQFKANYEAKDIQLNVEYYLQNETLSGYDNSSEYAQIETVKFNTNGQITPKSIEGFTYNNEYPENKTEYTVTTESPITLKVYYNRNIYNIEYVNGITNEKITASEENSKYVYNVEKVINFEPTLANYKFKCWTNTTTGTSNVSINGTQITINTGNKETLIFKAEYLLLSNINYNLGRNETTTNPTTYTVEDTITLTDAVKEGDYQFIGWYTNNNNILDVNKVTNISLGSSGDISLYPAFSYIGRDYTYGVYYSNGISVAMLDIYKGSETDIEVPKYITTENYEVVRINGLLTNNTAVTKVVIPNTVTSIVSKTFSGCTNLESVEIPDSVVNISGNIFTDCTKLQNVENNLIYIKTTTNNTYGVYGVVDKTVSSVVINNECKFVLNEAFKDCVNLDGITLTNKILSLGDSVFENCTTLPYITIPNSITQIPKLAFKGCTSLSNVVLNDNISYIGDSAFNGCELLQTLTIPSKVTELNSNLFSNCTALSSIIIPNNIKEIKDNVFSKCTSLTDITIPESVTKIYHSVFEDCTNLKNVDLRAKLTYLGSSVFNNCTSLQSEITIPEGITKIPQYAFANCSNLTKVNLHSNVTEIGNYAFQNTGKIEIDLSKIQIIGEYAFNKSQIEGNTEQDTDGTNIKVVRLDSAKNIMQQAFSESKIKNLVLLNVYKIGDSAFKDCSELISVDITSPDSGSYNDYDWKEKKGTTPVAFGPLCNDSLFENCTKLSIVDLSESKGQTIGKNAFANCGNIISISLPIRLEVIYEKAFYNSLNIERLELPRFLTVIQQNAFAQSIIENVVIATSEISRYTLNSGNAQTITLIIGLNAFQCVNLQYVIIESKGEEVASNVYNSFTSSIQVLTVSGTSFSSLKAKTVNVQSSSSSSKSNITLMSASNSNNIVPLGTGGGGSSSSIKFFVRASMSSIIHQALMRAGIKQVSASSTSAQKVANQLYTYYDRKDTASSNLINETNYWLYWTYIFNGSVTDVDIYCSVSYNRTKKEVGWKKWNDISSTDIVLS